MQEGKSGRNASTNLPLLTISYHGFMPPELLLLAWMIIGAMVGWHMAGKKPPATPPAEDSERERLVQEARKELDDLDGGL